MAGRTSARSAWRTTCRNAPGVYLFRGRDGRVLYVGKSKDLRARVKSYFYGDERKKIEDLLAQTTSIDGETCGSELEALVAEARLIRRHEPKYNRRGKTWRRYAYLKVDPAEAFPRLKIVRAAPPGDGCAYLGPFGSSSTARLAKEALEEVMPIRRCTTAMRARTRFAPCALADMGRCVAPCDGRVDPERYGELVRRLVSSLTSPGGLLGALERRMAHLAEQERYEEAGLVRDRLRALADALARGRTDAWLIGAGLARGAGPRGVGDPVRRRRVGSRETRPNRSRCRAHASGPTSSRPCAAGSARTTPGSRRANGRSPSPSTAARRSRASRRGSGRRRGGPDVDSSHRKGP